MSANNKDDLLNFSFYADYLSHKRSKFTVSHRNEGLALVVNDSSASLPLYSYSSSTKLMDSNGESEFQQSGAYSNDIDTSLILKQIIENSPDLIFSINLDFELISANQSCLNAFKKVFGINLNVGQSIFDQLSKFQDDCSDLRNTLSRSFSEESLCIDIPLSKTNSISPVYSAQFNSMKNAAGIVIGASCIFRDINNRALREDRLETLSKLDPVTRTINKREFKILLDQRIAANRRGEKSEATLMYVGVKGLSLIRTECGYNALDRCLLKISMRLRRAIPQSDILGRLADYDFGLLLDENNEKHYLDVAETIHDAVLKTTFKWKGRPYKLDCTIGLTKVNGKTIDAISALETADLACEIASDAKSPLFVNRHS